MSKKIFMVATSEVQNDVIVTDVDWTDDLFRAEKLAREFMMERVGDFFDIGQKYYQQRENVLNQYLSVETENYVGLTERYKFQIDGLSVSATVQEANIE